MYQPYSNSNSDVTLPIVEVSNGFNTSPLMTIIPPAGYSLTSVRYFHIERLTPVKWERVATIALGESFAFDPDIYYRVKVEYESTMVTTTSDRFILKRATTSIVETLVPYANNLSFQTLPVNHSEPNVNFIGLLSDNYQTDIFINTPKSLSFQFNTLPSLDITTEFVGLSTKNYLSDFSYNSPSMNSLQTSTITYNTFSPQFIGLGGV